MQGLERRGRLDPQLLVEPAAEAVVGRERLGLAAGAVEREHQHPVRRLAQRVRGDVRLELGDRVGVAAARDVGLDALLEAGQPQRLEMGGLDPRERLIELGERRAAPQVQRLAQQHGRPLRITRVQRRAPRLPQPREAGGVHVLALGDERVAGWPGLQRALRKHLAQLRDRDLDHLHRGRWDVLAPQVVHEPADRHRAVEVEEEPGEQRALPWAAELERPLPISHLERSEDAELHGWPSQRYPTPAC